MNRISPVPTRDCQTDCPFCKYLLLKKTGAVIYQTADIYVVRDRAPVDRFHILIIPRKHVKGIWQTRIIEVLKVAQHMLDINNITSFQLRINAGSYQHIPHFHLHVISDESGKPPLERHA